MTFKEWAKVVGVTNAFAYFDLVKAAWDAAAAEVKKDHFMIGEEVERQNAWTHWEKARIVACSAEECSLCEGRIRRIPEWEPKDGEAVLARSQSGYAFYAVSAGGGKIYSLEGVITAWDIKPWKPDCQGLPWEQV